MFAPILLEIVYYAQVWWYAAGQYFWWRHALILNDRCCDVILIFGSVTQNSLHYSFLSG